MQCMKCGRDLESGQVFCEECLAEMEKYPVKPGTVVLLPHRPSQQTAKKLPQRRKPAPEEQVLTLRKSVRGLVCALILAWAALAGVIYLAVTQYMEEEPGFLPGQNYSSISKATEPSGTEALEETTTTPTE